MPEAPESRPSVHERDLEAAVLQHAERRHQLVQLGHSVGARTLEAHHGHEIAVELARAKSVLQLLLSVEHDRRSLDDMAFGMHRGGLDDGAAETALQHAQPARRGEGRGHAREHGGVSGGFGNRPPGHPRAAVVALGEGLRRISPQSAAPDRLDVLVQQPAVEQFADDEGHAAGGMEMVHVGAAVGVDARQQRHHLGEVGEVLPGQHDAGRRRHRRQVQRVVGRPTGRVQADDAVDEGALVEHAAERRVGVAGGGQSEDAPRRLAGQRVTQPGAGIDEGGAGQVQAHHLHQHLVGVGGAVEGAGARPVVGGHLGLEQLVATDLALGVELADVALLGVGDARRQSGRAGMKTAGRCPNDNAPITRPGTILSQMPR